VTPQQATRQAAAVPLLPRSRLRVGDQMAEGGEGRVFDLSDQPGVLYKEYRRPHAATDLSALVAWPDGELSATTLRNRVRAATAWPTAVVGDGTHVDGAPAAVGLLMPRAPRRFTVRHRDGVVRLATLSYLTADPVRRASAYGLRLPAHGDSERIGIVYALARLLEAWEAGTPRIGHGDLSAKNVLWSTGRGPQVYVLDCDNGERFGPAGDPLGVTGKRRAMTPNWDDPTVEGNPGVLTDRYSLALIFLRIVGAAHFPVQKRQKAGEAVDIEFDLPPQLLRAPTTGPDAPIWSLVSRSLSVVEPAGRPPASTWAAALHDVLADIGGRPMIDAIHAGQSSPEPSIPAAPVAGPPAPDVTVRPRAARPRSQAWARTTVIGRQGPGRPPGGSGRAPAGRAGPAPARPAGPVATAIPAGSVRAVNQPPPPIGAQVRTSLVAAAALWLHIHRSTLRHLRARSAGVRRLVACGLIDIAIACVLVMLVAMIVSPFLGI
jgi:hypothetical protein